MKITLPDLPAGWTWDIEEVPEGAKSYTSSEYQINARRFSDDTVVTSYVFISKDDLAADLQDTLNRSAEHVWYYEKCGDSGMSREELIVKELQELMFDHNERQYSEIDR